MSWQKWIGPAGMAAGALGGLALAPATGGMSAALPLMAAGGSLGGGIGGGVGSAMTPPPPPPGAPPGQMGGMPAPPPQPSAAASLQEFLAKQQMQKAQPGMRF